MKKLFKNRIVLIFLAIVLVFSIAAGLIFQTGFLTSNRISMSSGNRWVVRVRAVTSATGFTVTPTINTWQTNRNSQGRYEVVFNNQNVSFAAASQTQTLSFAYEIHNDSNFSTQIEINNAEITGSANWNLLVEDINITRNDTSAILYRYQMTRNILGGFGSSTITNSGNTFTLGAGQTIRINISIRLGRDMDEWYGNVIDINVLMPFTATQIS